MTATPDKPEFTWPFDPEAIAEARDVLKMILVAIEEHDENYEPRYALVLAALFFANVAGYPVGIAIDPAVPAWPVVYIELPTGQVSWHMPAHPTPFDGHSTPEKYARIKAYVAAEVIEP